jgi:tetratricopeptide (TPR) repeat protein
MKTALARATLAACVCALVAGCGSTPALVSQPVPFDDPPPASNPAPSLPPPQRAFEQQQRERALALARAGRLADAALAWEVLLVLRPEAGEYRERWADTQRQIDAAVTQRLPRAALAARRGELDAAAQHYLAVLALQPQHEQAADALRAVERERNKRNFLGKHARFTLTRRAVADAEMPPAGSLMAGRNEVEHAALLAGDGELDDAIGLLERRLVAERRDTAARRLLADVYYRKAESLLPHDRPAAVTALEKSVRLDPSQPRSAARLRQLKGVLAAPPAHADVKPAR